jgi:hypothetical protein
MPNGKLSGRVRRLDNPGQAFNQLVGGPGRGRAGVSTEVMHPAILVTRAVSDFRMLKAVFIDRLQDVRTEEHPPQVI